MFNPISAHVDAARKAPESMPIEVVNNVFKVMHGFYGNLFLSKFATGDLVTQAGPERGPEQPVGELLTGLLRFGHRSSSYRTMRIDADPLTRTTER